MSGLKRLAIFFLIASVLLNAGVVLADSTVILQNAAVEYTLPPVPMVLQSVAAEYARGVTTPMVLQNTAIEYLRLPDRPAVLNNVALEYARGYTAPMVLTGVAIEYELPEGVAPDVAISVASGTEPLSAGAWPVTMTSAAPLAEIALRFTSDFGTEEAVHLENPSGDSVTWVGYLDITPYTGDGIGRFAYLGTSTSGIVSDRITAGETVAVDASGIVFVNPGIITSIAQGAVEEVVFELKNVDNEAHEFEIEFFGSTGVRVLTLDPYYRTQLQAGETCPVTCEVSGETLPEGAEGSFHLRLTSHSVPLVTFATGTAYIGFPKPDLSIVSTEVWAYPGNSVDPWEDFTINATVRNLGDAPATNVMVRFFNVIDSAPVGTLKNVGTINPGGSVTVASDTTVYFNPAVLLYTAYADPANAIPELSEGNNEGATVIAVGGGGGMMGGIVVEATASATVPANRSLPVSGRAWYTIGAETYPVKGAMVIAVVTPPPFNPTNTGFPNTLADGSFSGEANHPMGLGGYQIQIKVRDNTYEGVSLPVNFTVTAPIPAGETGTPSPPSPPQPPAPSGPGMPGTFVPDAWVESYGIFFNPPAPRKGESVTVTAEVHCDTPVDVWVEFRYKIAGALVGFGGDTAYLSLGNPAYVSRVFTPFVNQLHIIEVELRPQFAQRSTTNDIATRALEVGGIPGPLTAFLDSPENDQELGGTVQVTGYATGSDFTSYTLTYQPASGGDWDTITTGDSPVSGGTLGAWNTTALADGDYNLLLTVNGSGAPPSVSDQALVHVYNSLSVRIYPVPPLVTVGDSINIHAVSSHRLYAVEAATLTDNSGVVYNLPIGEMYSDTQYIFRSDLLPPTVADGPAVAYLRVRDIAGNVADDSVLLSITNAPFRIVTYPAVPGTINPALGESSLCAYELSQPATVTVNIRVLGTDLFIMNLLDSVPQSRGIHEVTWDGSGQSRDWNYYFEVIGTPAFGSGDRQTERVDVNSRTPVIRNLQDAPAVFYPAGPDAIISFDLYSLPPPSGAGIVSITVTITDFAGNPVRTLTDGINPSEDIVPVAIPWDGNDDGGTQVGDGIYQYSVVASRLGGNYVTSAQTGIIAAVVNNTATLAVGPITIHYDPADGPLTINYLDEPQISALEAVKNQGGYLESDIYAIEPDGKVFTTPALMVFNYDPTKYGGLLGLTEFDTATDAWINLNSLYDERDNALFTELTTLCEFAILAVKLTDLTPPAIGPFIVSPAAISPNGDGANDTTGIAITITDNQPGLLPQAHLRITNALGEEVAALLDGQSIRQGRMELAWDGGGLPEGAYTIELSAYDLAGNLAGPVTQPLVIDLTAPQLAVGSPEARPYSAGEALTISFAAADPLSGIEALRAELDGVAVQNGEVINLITLPLGEHAFTLAATDRAGNSSFVTIHFTTVDNEPPTITIAPVTTPTNQDVTLSYTVSDNVTPPEQIVVTGDASPYTAEGAYTVVLTATDMAGNAAMTTVGFTIDKTAPVTVLSVGSPSSNGFVTAATPLTLTATDNLTAVTSVRYRLNGGEWLSYAGPFTLTGEGAHLIEFTSTDAAGNIETVNRTTLTVDGIAPASSLAIDLTSADGTIAVPESAITLSASDTGCGVEKIEYQVNGGNWVTYSAPFELGSIVGLGPVTIGYRAVDHLGNAEAERTATWEVRKALTVSARLLTTPRVLAWVNAPSPQPSPPGGEGEMGAALAAVLDSAALDYLIVETPGEFLAKLTDYNVFFIVGDEGELEDEGDSLVAAQVALGKTLVSFGYEDIKTPDDEDRGWENIFGIKVAGVLNGTAHLATYPDLAAETTTLTIEGQTERITELLAGEVLGEVALIERGEHGDDDRGERGSRGRGGDDDGEEGRGHGDEEHGQDGDDHNDTWPAIIANTWGAGRTLYLAPDYPRNQAVLAGLLTNAIAWAQPATEIAAPGGVVGVTVNVRNAVLPVTLRVYVEAFLPAGSDATAVYDNGTDQGNVVVWAEDLAAGAEGEYRFLLRLPTEPGPYTIRVEASYSKGGLYRVSDTYDLVLP